LRLQLLLLQKHKLVLGLHQQVMRSGAWLLLLVLLRMARRKEWHVLLLWMRMLGRVENGGDVRRSPRLSALAGRSGDGAGPECGGDVVVIV